MPRENIIPNDQKERESTALSRFFALAQNREPELTQMSLALEMDVSQGMIQKWMAGKSAIPAKRLLWLAKRLNFDPSEVRPDFDQAEVVNTYTSKEQHTLNLYRIDPNFRKVVDAIAETSPFYKNIQKQSDKSHE